MQKGYMIDGFVSRPLGCVILAFLRSLFHSQESVPAKGHWCDTLHTNTNIVSTNKLALGWQFWQQDSSWHQNPKPGSFGQKPEAQMCKSNKPWVLQKGNYTISQKAVNSLCKLHQKYWSVPWLGSTGTHLFKMSIFSTQILPWFLVYMLLPVQHTKWSSCTV